MPFLTVVIGKRLIYLQSCTLSNMICYNMVEYNVFLSSGRGNVALTFKEKTCILEKMG